MNTKYFVGFFLFWKEWFEINTRFTLLQRYTNPSDEAVYYVENQLFWMKKGLKAIGNIYKRKLLYKYGIIVGNYCTIGKNLRLPHPIGIVIGEHAVIGNNCTIYQEVTIGVKNSIGSLKKTDYPNLGNKVILYAGSKVIGGISLGDRTVVGANTVIHKSTESNSIWRGNPAIEISKNNK